MLQMLDTFSNTSPLVTHVSVGRHDCVSRSQFALVSSLRLAQPDEEILDTMPIVVGDRIIVANLCCANCAYYARLNGIRIRPDDPFTVSHRAAAYHWLMDMVYAMED